LHTGNAAPPPDGIIGLRTWSPATYNSAPEGADDASNNIFYLSCGFGPACGGSGDTAATGFRAPFHKSVSQLSILTTARTMIDQGTYRSSACPYECTRRTTRFEVVKSNEANMLSGLGLLGEGFVYPGHLDSNSGFSRFPGSGSTEGQLHPLHMSHNVTMDECDAIVERHQLLAPHGVWMVNQEHEDGFASAERLGDCGLFLGARSSVDADLWRAFYRYARMVLRLGHVDTWLDDDVVAAIVHSSAETACNSATSKVCLWWSEFDLDDEEYSCRPKRDASNIVTPSILLATLAENRVAYPPPSPPPPTPPSSPPAPSPPPGAIRCELSGIATTSGYKVPAYDLHKKRMVPVQQKCWRWDPANDWPPFVAHRDLYQPRDRCSGARSRDVQWEGGFKQSLITKGTFDPLHQNNDDCPWKRFTWSPADYDARVKRRDRLEDGAECSDGGDATQTASQNDQAQCDLGTNLQSCGIRKNLVVFGFAYLNSFTKYVGDDLTVGAAAYQMATPESGGTSLGVGNISNDLMCILIATGSWNTPAGRTERECRDGGPGSVSGECFYGTDPFCGKRRFAFALEEAGPDVPDDSCATAGNRICEDGLLWSEFAPGKNPCAPNTDVRHELKPHFIHRHHIA
jgi:hypothetical protein